MTTSAPAFVRELHPGMGQAVAERTVLRRKPDGTFEGWGDVAERVARGNTLLMTGREMPAEQEAEYVQLRDLIASAGVIMSGRHLQHGDCEQPNRNLEVFSNCATAPTSFLLFQLLLSGSGVGRCYDDDMMLVNWDDAPTVWCVLDEEHEDFDHSQHLSARNARHMFNNARDMLWFDVPDTREGWSKALEMVEVAAFERVHKDKLLILDFSKVRCKGSPIKGMQDRPSSGPVPLMNAFAKAMMIRGGGLPRWQQAMYVDHFFAECVLVGGARRAARMSTKWWKDVNVLDFIHVKRPVEYYGMKADQVLAYRAEGNNPQAFLWSSNNSVAVDAEFWREADVPGTWANQVFEAVVACSYGDGTGEPGFVNVDKLNQNDEGWDDLYRGDYVGSKRFQPEENTHIYLAKLAKRAKKKQYHMITNPCGEVSLNLLGGYCVIADTVPFHCMPELDDAMTRDEFNVRWDDAFEEAARVAVRALIRVNTMDSVYGREVVRTNRIGVGLTGIHEWMWARFGAGFNDVMNNEGVYGEVADVLARVSRAVQDEAIKYSTKLGMAVPHTSTTIKPSGTVSKLFGLTEGAHLPAMAWYMRWVQFSNGDPLIADYATKGYPTKVLEQYKGHTIVGFPTQPVIAALMPEDRMVTAAEATPGDQYAWVWFLENYWIKGDPSVQRSKLWTRPYGNQVSYTLKYDPERVTIERFREMMLQHQPQITACSVMPQQDTVAYEYQPEQPVTKAQFEGYARAIERVTSEDVGMEHLECEGGACPVDFNVEKGVVGDAGYA